MSFFGFAETGSCNNNLVAKLTIFFKGRGTYHMVGTYQIEVHTIWSPKFIFVCFICFATAECFYYYKATFMKTKQKCPFYIKYFEVLDLETFTGVMSTQYFCKNKVLQCLKLRIKINTARISNWLQICRLWNIMT